MPTVREKIKSECYKLTGDMMDISEGLVDKVEDEDFEDASKEMATLAHQLSSYSQALAGLKMLGEETLEMNWDEFEEQSKEKQREYNRQMKNILGQMLGLDLNEDEED